MLVVSILIGLVAVFSLAALVIPFFFIFPRYLLALYFLIDQNMGPIKACDASWKATKGHLGKLWGIILATIAMALLMLTVIGIPFALYFLIMYGAAYAVAYEYINKHAVAPPAPISASAPQPMVSPPPAT